MINIKQLVKPIYYALKDTRLYGVFNTLNNFLFRNNNLLFSLLLAKIQRNNVRIGRNVYFKDCRFEIEGGVILLL